MPPQTHGRGIESLPPTPKLPTSNLLSQIVWGMYSAVNPSHATKNELFQNIVKLSITGQIYCGGGCDDQGELEILTRILGLGFRVSGVHGQICRARRRFR